MPRVPRQIVADVCYHVLNRGNDRRKIFHKQADYLAFLSILDEGLSRYQVELFSWCLMPNHWHLVVRPLKDKALSGFMQWVTVTHVRRYYEHYPEKSGHLYQGRFKAFPVEADDYFLTLCRYVEANAKRAKMVQDAAAWRWSSLVQRREGMVKPRLTRWPLDIPEDWHSLVNEPQPEAEMQDLKTSIARDRPFGHEAWAKRIAAVIGLGHTLRPIGRPQKPLAKLSPRQRRRRLKPSKMSGQKGK